MNKELVKGKKRFATHVPNGPVVANSSSSQETGRSKTQVKNGIYKAFISDLGIYCAAVLTKILYWAEKGRKKSGDLKGFRSVVDIAKDIGGISPSAVWNHVHGLEKGGYLEITHGRPCGDLNRAHSYKIPQRVVDMAKPRRDPTEKSDLVYFGLDDAITYGIGPALLLTHLEWNALDGDDATGYITTRTTADYFGVNQKQVDRWITSLKGKNVIVETEGKRPRRYLSIAEGLDRLPSVNGDKYANRVEQIERQAHTQVESISSVEHPRLNAQEPTTRGLMSAQRLEVEPLRQTDSEEVFRALAQVNHNSSIEPDDETMDTVRRFIESLDIENLVSLTSSDPDATLSFFMRSGYDQCPSNSNLGAELFTLALHLRRCPWLPSSSYVIRREAHRLAMTIQGRLQEIRRRRADLMSVEHLEHTSDLAEQEKVNLLVETLHYRNQVGLEIPVSEHYDCLNPEVRHNYVQNIPHGKAGATSFFRKNKEYSVAEILQMLDACARSPARSEDRYLSDPWRNRRTGNRLDSFFRNFSKIADEMD